MGQNSFYLRLNGKVIGPLPQIKISELKNQSILNKTTEISSDKVHWQECREITWLYAPLNAPMPIPQSTTQPKLSIEASDSPEINAGEIRKPIFVQPCDRKNTSPELIVTCPRCAAQLAPCMSSCYSCGMPIGHETFNSNNSFTGGIADFLGLCKLEGFSFSKLFSEVFAHHTKEETEAIFAAGTEKTTPELKNINSTWPTPWMFVRLFLLCWGVYYAFYWLLVKYPFEPNLVPGVIISGSFAIPITILFLFYEFNIVKNVSVFQLMKLLFIGGIISFIATFINGELPFVQNLAQILQASIGGLTEEPAKLIAVIILVGFSSRYKYTLNGILFGAAVGTGFAAFESAGYAFTVFYGIFMDNLAKPPAGLEENAIYSNAWISGLDSMINTIDGRAFLSPFAHILWTGLTAGALWKVKGDRVFEFGMLFDLRFIKVMIFAVVLHMCWNWNFLIYPIPFIGDIKFLILGVIGWLAMLLLIQSGINEVKVRQIQESANN